jgi:MGT family glycosyltransferase
MTHFGFLCPAATGHLNSLLPLGCELQRRGHRVTVFQVADVASTIAAAGLTFHPIGEKRFPLGKMSQITQELGQLTGLAAVRYSVEWIRQMTQMVLEDAPDAIQVAGVDALVIDQLLVEGETLAQRVDRPFITFCSALPLHREPLIPPFLTHWSYRLDFFSRARNALGYAGVTRLTRPVTEEIQTYRDRYGLPLYPKGYEPFSPLLQLSQEPAAFEYPRTTLPPWFHYTGPLHDGRSRDPVPFPYERLDGQPLVYASLGTLQNRLSGLYKAIEDACNGLPVQLVISMGTRLTEPSGAILEHFPEMGSNKVIVVPYAPQIELLSQAALTVTHAGLNTTLESLTYGVPLVAIPITNDQPGVAARIAWNGAGVVVPCYRATVARLRRAIQQVLSQSHYRQNVGRLQQAIQQSGGVCFAADLVEQAIATGQPVIEPCSPRMAVSTPVPL